MLSSEVMYHPFTLYCKYKLIKHRGRTNNRTPRIEGGGGGGGGFYMNSVRRFKKKGGGRSCLHLRNVILHFYTFPGEKITALYKKKASEREITAFNIHVHV